MLIDKSDEDKKYFPDFPRLCLKIVYSKGQWFRFKNITPPPTTTTISLKISLSIGFNL